MAKNFHGVKLYNFGLVNIGYEKHSINLPTYKHNFKHTISKV